MFCQKLPIRTAYHTFLESKHPEVTKNLYYVLSTCRSQSVIFRIQLMDFYYFFRFQRGEGQLKGRTVIGEFVVFELVVVLRITKLHTHYITFSGIWNFLLRWTLICKYYFLSSEKHIDLCFTSPVELLLLSLKFCFFCETVRGISQ